MNTQPCKQIPLKAWGARHYDPPPSQRTLRSWVRNGRISPAPIKVGREYRVLPDASYVPRLRPLAIPPITVIESSDPVVNEILNSA